MIREWIAACRPIVSTSSSRRARSPSSGRARAKHRPAAPCCETSAPRVCRIDWLVNPHYDEIEGVRSVKTIRDLPEAPDLARDRGAAAVRPRDRRRRGRTRRRAAIIITAGLGHGPGSLAEACEKAARATGLRLVGPNCLGVMAPRAKLNASFAARMPPAGDLALISQSGAIAAGMVEWAAGRGIGFSAIVSIGDQLDVDFGDLLDYFALDRATRAILLYIESIKDARKFMSAARAAARTKPVVVIKAGRHAQGAKAAATHTGALAGSDAVYDAAFRRAGLLRVLDLGRAVRRRRDARPDRSRSRQAPGDPHQWRRRRRAGGRPA